MYLCLCKAVRVREVRQIVREHGCTPEEVARCTGAGTACGSCIPDLCRVVAEEARESEAMAAK